MGKNSGVPWADHSWGPWRGCHKVSAGCDNCYGERDMKRFGKDHSQVVKANDATFYAPLKWKEPARVFVCPWSDFWIEEADGLWRWRALQVIAQTPHLTYIIPTKRPERIIKVFYEDGAMNWPGVGNLILPNVWHLVSVENQEAADKRILELLRLREYGNWPVLGVSAEPLLESIQLSNWLGKPWARDMDKRLGAGCGFLDWVVTGSESGSNRRHSELDWFRSLRDQCSEAEAPYFLKQISENGKLVKEPCLDGKQFLELPWVAKPEEVSNV